MLTRRGASRRVAGLCLARAAAAASSRYVSPRPPPQLL